MQPQEPYYFEIVNRTAFTLRYVDRSGSDFPNGTNNLTTNDVIKPGELSGDKVGLRVASASGTAQWGRVYFRFEGPGSRCETIMLYLHSNTPDDNYYNCVHLDDGACRPSGRESHGAHTNGRLIGNTSARSNNRQWIVFSGGDIAPPLRMDWWMADLIDHHKPEARHWPISRFKIPGTHDSATYGSGPDGEFNWKCQDLSLWDQMRAGIRCLDVRLKSRRVDGQAAYRFFPHHGPADGTAPDFAVSPEDRGPNTLARDIAYYAETHWTEIFIINIDVGSIDYDSRGDFAKTIRLHLGPRLVSYSADFRTPTYQEVMDQGSRNIILRTAIHEWPANGHNDIAWIQSGRFDWGVPQLAAPADNSLLYNDDTWKSGDPEKVINSIAKYVDFVLDEQNQDNRLWVAQVQLTPSLDNPFGNPFPGENPFGDLSKGEDFFDFDKLFKIDKLFSPDVVTRYITSPSYSPRHLAWDTLPQMKWRVPDAPVLMRQGNIIAYDFAEESMNGAITTMNFSN